MVTTSLVGVLAGLRPLRSKGSAGEKLAAKRLGDLNPEYYHLFHDLYVPCAGGQELVQVDHVVVSRFGIFVIETKDFDGWLFGNARQTMWTRSRFGRHSQFPNPLLENQRNVHALKTFLSLNPRQFHPLVFFVDGDFRSEMPGDVICSDPCGHIVGHRPILLDEATLGRAIRLLEELERHTDRKAAKAKLALQAKERGNPGPRVTGERDLPGELAEAPPLARPAPASPWSAGAEAKAKAIVAVAASASVQGVILAGAGSA
jgi:hypothetical protein